MKNTKDKSEFDWDDTGKLKIRYDDSHSASLRFFPSDKVIAKTLAKFVKKPAIRSKGERHTISSPKKKEPK